jgi:threonylcarbamoyladenosine tRNA methylthiotransferase MtaB
MPTFRVITLGCKVNQCDGQEIAGELAALGYEVAPQGRAADLYVVNTCTVTATADAKARKLIHKLGREHPDALLLVTGCYAQRDRASLAAIPGVDAVVGNAAKGEIARWAEAHAPPASPETGTLPSSALRAERARAFVKVQDGCDHGCAFCIVPRVRGRPRSRPLGQVLEEVGRLAEAGAQEVVLCGIRLGSYGRDAAAASLATLLRALRAVPIPRLRLSSLEPMDVTDDLLAEAADHPRLCHHLHLPLQSGDDEVLRQMGRGYTAAQFLDLVARTREMWPDVALSTEVMAGFPGETGEQFRRTTAFLGKVGFSRLHVFPFSPRPGTPAASRADQVPAREKRQRTEALLVVAAELAQKAAEGWVGKPVSVLFEERDAGGRLAGLTEYYVRLRCEGPDEWRGRIARATPKCAQAGELLA